MQHLQFVIDAEAIVRNLYYSSQSKGRSLQFVWFQCSTFFKSLCGCRLVLLSPCR